MKDFIRKNELDDRTQDALWDLSKPHAMEVMGTDGGRHSFVLQGVRNADAVVMSRIRQLKEHRRA